MRALHLEHHLEGVAAQLDAIHLLDGVLSRGGVSNWNDAVRGTDDDE